MLNTFDLNDSIKRYLLWLISILNNSIPFPWQHQKIKNLSVTGVNAIAEQLIASEKKIELK